MRIPPADALNLQASLGTAPVPDIKSDWDAVQRLHKKRQRREQIYSRLRIFRGCCPKAYRRTDPRIIGAAKVNGVMEWQYGPKGLLLIGPTGTGKTRCAWLLMRRLMVVEGRSARAFDGVGWALAVSAAFGNPATTERWLNKICEPDLLLLDDLGKGWMTEAQGIALYGVVERRMAHCRPLIVTMNATGFALGDRMTGAGQADRADAIMRRLVECCERLRFT